MYQHCAPPFKDDIPSKLFFQVFSSCWTARGHMGRSTKNSNPVMTSSAGDAKGYLDHRFRAPPAYTAQLLTLHQHRANNQYRTANKIWPTLRVSSSSTQATFEQSPIQVLTEINVAWLQWSYENWYFQVDKPLQVDGRFRLFFASIIFLSLQRS